jgi:hypothetical protein
MMMRTPLSSGRRSRRGLPSDRFTPALPQPLMASPAELRCTTTSVGRTAAELDRGLEADVRQQRQLEPDLRKIGSVGRARRALLDGTRRKQQLSSRRAHASAATVTVHWESPTLRREGSGAHLQWDQEPGESKPWQPSQYRAFVRLFAQHAARALIHVYVAVTGVRRVQLQWASPCGDVGEPHHRIVESIARCVGGVHPLRNRPRSATLYSMRIA